GNSAPYFRKFYGTLSVAAAASATAVSTPATPPAAARAPTAPPSAAKSSARRLGPRFIDVQCAAVHLGAVKLRNRGFRLALVGHFDKRKTPRLHCVSICNNVS